MQTVTIHTEIGAIELDPLSEEDTMELLDLFNDGQPFGSTSDGEVVAFNSRNIIFITINNQE